MSTIAIIGAGSLGGALAHKLAGRSRVARIRLIDPQGRVAEGKALDIQQSGPVEQFNTRLDAATDYGAAAGADVIVFADLVASGEVTGEAGLALVRNILRFEPRAPLLFAGGSQRDLMVLTIRELHASTRRVLGSAPLALESALRAVAGALADVSPNDLSIAVAGVPPHDVAIGWEAATAFNQPISRVLPAHQMAAISDRIGALWPPSPYTLGSAAARAAEALALGSRRRYTCFAGIDLTSAGRNIVAAVPVEIVKGGIGKTLEPALSRRERTAFENAFR